MYLLSNAASFGLSTSTLSHVVKLVVVPEKVTTFHVDLVIFELDICR